RRVIALRAKHPVLRRKRYYQGKKIRGSEERDLTWLRPDGGEMTDEEWGAGWNRSMAVMLAGEALGEVDEKGDLIVDDTLLLLLNAHTEPVEFTLPGDDGAEWEELIDTTRADGVETGERQAAGAGVTLGDRSLLLLRMPNGR